MTDDTADQSITVGSSVDPMTEEQRLKLDSLSNKTGEPTPGDHLTEREAEEVIKKLRDEAGYDTTIEYQDEP